MNVSSDKIKIFPSGRRINSNDPFSRLISESTLTSIVNRLIDTDGFVITSVDNFATSNPIEFNIHGYYFKVSPASAITDSFSSSGNDTIIYATIELVETTDSSGVKYTELACLDTGGVCSAVDFSTTLSPTTSRYSIPLLKKVGGNWAILPEFTVKFNSKSTELSIDRIDGGEI